MSIFLLTFKCFHPEVLHVIFSHIHWTEHFTWVHVVLEVEEEWNSFYARVRRNCIKVNSGNVCHIWDWQLPTWPLLVRRCIVPSAS